MLFCVTQPSSISNSLFSNSCIHGGQADLPNQTQFPISNIIKNCQAQLSSNSSWAEICLFIWYIMYVAAGLKYVAADQKYVAENSWSRSLLKGLTIVWHNFKIILMIFNHKHITSIIFSLPRKQWKSPLMLCSYG